MTTVDDEVMAARLAANCFANRNLQRLVAFGLAQWGAQVLAYDANGNLVGSIW